jgi:hypothetical protein
MKLFPDKTGNIVGATRVAHLACTSFRYEAVKKTIKIYKCCFIKSFLNFHIFLICTLHNFQARHD